MLLLNMLKTSNCGINRATADLHRPIEVEIEVGVAWQSRIANTAQQQLLAEGYLAARHGSGTFVAEELPDDLPQRIAPRRFARTGIRSCRAEGRHWPACPDPLGDSAVRRAPSVSACRRSICFRSDSGRGSSPDACAP